MTQKPRYERLTSDEERIAIDEDWANNLDTPSLIDAPDGGMWCHKDELRLWRQGRASTDKSAGVK